MTLQPVTQHQSWHFPLGQDAIAGDPWVYIGTIGVDGVDAYLNGNPQPFNPLYSDYINIPFQNGWTNLLGDFSPVCFMLTVEDNLEIHGAFWNASAFTPPTNSTVFTLPTLPAPPEGNAFSYFPAFSKPLIAPLTPPATGTFNYYVDNAGNVIYLG